MKTPIKYALIYLLIGSLWIILSDLFVLANSSQVDLAVINSEIWKGLAFVFVTSVLVYFLLLQSNRKLALENERIRQHETLLENIIDNNKDDYALLDDEDRILYTNDVQVKGAIDDFLGRLQLPEKELRELKLLISRARNEKMEMEREYLSPNHSSYSKLIIIPLEKNQEVLVIHRDQTSTKSKEKQHKTNLQMLNLILRSNDIGIWEWDLARNTYSSNEAFKRVIGLEADDAAPSNAEWITRIHDEDREAVSSSYALHLSGETDIHKSSYRFLTYKNIWKWILDYSLVTERDENGEPTRIIGIILDTDHEQRNKEMIANQGKIIQQIALANSHHVRGPVARIQGLIQLMETMQKEKPLTDEECKDILNKIKTSSEDLDKALNDFAALLNS